MLLVVINEQSGNFSGKLKLELIITYHLKFVIKVLRKYRECNTYLNG